MNEGDEEILTSTNELDEALRQVDLPGDSHKSRIMRSAISLCIDEAISHVFGPVRDDVVNPYKMRDHGNYPAMILVALYVEYGCDMDDLASELLIVDLRGRNQGRHPRIDKLYGQYRELKNDYCFVRGFLLRKFKRLVDDELNKILSEL